MTALYSIFLDDRLYARAIPSEVPTIAEEIELQGYSLVEATWDRRNRVVYLRTGEY